MNTDRVVNVAVAQMSCVDGEVEKNLERAGDFVLQASRQGAQLLLFPELMPQGYGLTPELWSKAETLTGPTSSWLIDQARRSQMYIGTSFLECDGKDFWNSFGLASPEGKLHPIVRKRFPSMWEAYFFKGADGSQFIDTELGRIGVGICFDNHTYEVGRRIAQAQPDLILMPHSYATPYHTSKLVSQADIDRLNDLPLKVAGLYNEWLGVPVLLANKCGSWLAAVPKTLLGQPKDYSFSGHSLIVDADGKRTVQMGLEEGLGFGTIHLDPIQKKTCLPPKYSRYVYPGPAGREVLRVIEWSGAWSYRMSRERRQAARAFATPQPEMKRTMA